MNSSDDILVSLLVQEAFGSALVVEPRRDGLLEALAATVTEVTLCAARPDADDVEALEALGCAVDKVKPKALGGSADRASLIIGGLPRGVTPEEFLDLALSKTYDDGFVLVDIETESRSQKLRIRRLLEASLEDVRDAEGWGEDDRLCLTGRRRATGREAVQEFPDEPLPLTVLCYVGPAAAPADVLAVSLLFRQTHFPALVLFLDDSPDSEAGLPDDLWGMAAHAPAQPALLRTGGVGRAKALQEAMEHVETTYAAVAEPGQVPAPRWAEQACSVLELFPEAGLAITEGLCFSTDGTELGAYSFQSDELAPRNLMADFVTDCGLLPPAGAVVYRSSVLAAAIADAAGDSGDEFEACLALHACDHHDAVTVPLPLISFSEGSPGAEREALVRLQQRGRLDRLVAALSMLPEEQRRGVALEIRADALLESGAAEESLADYRAALELDPELPDLRASFLLALRHSGRAEEVIGAAEDWLTEQECDIRIALLVSWAHDALGRNDAAREILEQLEESVPDDPRVLLNLLIIDSDERTRERARRLAEELSGDMEDGDLAAYCF